MKRRSEGGTSWDVLRDEIVGLGARSMRKSYFRDLRRRVSELADSERRFHVVFDQSLDLMWLLAPDGTVAQANAAAAATSRAGSGALTGARWDELDIWPARHRSRIASAIATAASGSAARFEAAARGASGRMTLDVSVTPILDDERRVVLLAAAGRDITDRKRGERAMRAAKARAETAARAEAQFLSIASHELRTPLTTLILAIQSAIRQRSAGTPVESSALERLLRQARRLQGLVEDLLDVSRLRHGRLTIRPQPVDLAAVAREAVEEFRAQWPGRALTLEVPPQPAVVLADGTRIAQVLSNLLENAAKYSPAGALVEVRVALDGDTAVASVVDHGPGIPAADVERVFAPFARLRPVEERRPGLGLGLYISRQLVELHGGALTVDSAPGRGSAFSIRLPRAT